MVWFINFVDEGDYTISKVALDENGKPIPPRQAFRLEYIDRTPDWPGVGGNFKTGDPNLGRAIKPEGVHKRLIWEGRKGRIQDTFSAFSQFIINDRFLKLIKRFEGERHQFIPIEVLYKDKSHAQNMYLMNICSRLDTLDPELTTATISKSGMLKPETGATVFSEARIGDHHIWHDKHLFAGTFVSDELHDAIEAEGFSGVYFTPRESTGDAK